MAGQRARDREIFGRAGRSTQRLRPIHPALHRKSQRSRKVIVERRYHGSRSYRERASQAANARPTIILLVRKNRVYVERLRIRHILPQHSDFISWNIAANQSCSGAPGIRTSDPRAPLRLFLGTAVLACKGRFALRPCILRAPMPAGRLRRRLRGIRLTMPGFDFRKSGAQGVRLSPCRRV